MRGGWGWYYVDSEESGIKRLGLGFSMKLEFMGFVDWFNVELKGWEELRLILRFLV